MPQIYFLLPTAIGEAKLANAQALGIPLKLAAMAVGDGNGVLPVPSRDRTALVNEKRRAAINSIVQNPSNPSQFIAEQIIPENEGGWWIREGGLFDIDGDLIYYANIPETYKPLLAEGSGRNQVVRLVGAMTGSATVELKVDPSIVLATRDYVDTQLAAELAKRDAKQSVLVATTGPLPALSGLLTIDGVVLPAGARVLVKDQAAGKDNGIYVAAPGAWSRASDADAAIEVTPGMLVPVEQGDKNADSLWQLATDGAIVIGTTALSFDMAAGKTGVTAGTYSSVTVDMRGRVTGGTNPQASETVAGPVMAATQAETDDGTNDSKFITPKKLVAWTKQATAAVLGMAKIATQAETDEGTDDTKIVTPKKLLAWTKQATEVLLGMAKVATQAETNAGTDDAKFVTPKKLRFGILYSFGTTGYLVFPTWLGGLVIQWGLWNGINNDNAINVTFPIAYPNAAYVVVATQVSPGGAAGRIVEVAIRGTTYYDAWGNSTANAIYYISLGR